LSRGALRSRGVFSLLVAQVAAGAAPVREGAAWTAYGHDAQLANFVPSRVLTPKTAPRLRRVWSRRLDGWIVASPLVAPGPPATVVVATEGSSVVALAASTGKVLWRRSLGTVAAAKCGTWGISSTGTIDLARGRVYVIGASGELHALSLATGEEAPGWPVRLIERTRYEYVWGGLRLSGKRLYVPVASYCDIADDAGVSAEGRLVAVDVDDPTHTETFDPVPGYGNLGGIWGYGASRSSRAAASSTRRSATRRARAATRTATEIGSSRSRRTSPRCSTRIGR
jgi:PQQ-like domain